jgi:hypothetical protein
MAKKTVHADADLATQLITGTAKHLASSGQLLLASGSFTPAEVTAQLQAIVNLRAEVDTAKASTQAKLAALDAQMPAHRVFMDAFVSFVKAAFGNSPEVLADFGLKPKKAATPLTVEAKAAANAKRAATRAARHVMGAQQRKDVVGNVTGVVVTPVTAPTTQPAQPQPVATTATSNGTSAPAPSGGATAGTTPHTA